MGLSLGKKSKIEEVKVVEVSKVESIDSKNKEVKVAAKRGPSQREIVFNSVVEFLKREKISLRS